MIQRSATLAFVAIAGLLLASQMVRADDLQTFAQQCDAATSSTVPDFDCDAGTEVPAQGPTFSGNGTGITCDEPNRLNSQCDPGSRFQVLTSNADAYVVAHCRKEGGGPGLYGDVAVIQYGRKTGATCFYQALGNQSHGDMPTGSSAPGASAKPMLSPTHGQIPNSLWMSPSGVAGIGCGGCHDNGPLIRSPYLNQVTGANKLPGSDDFGFNSTQPYAFVGQAFASWKAYKVEVASDECNGCHRLGVNNVRAGKGTALDFAIKATSAFEVSKNPPSAQSPIWMPPAPVQIAFNQAHAAAAQAIHDCAARFDANNLPSGADCRITLFATAYTGPPPPPPGTSHNLEAIYYLLGARHYAPSENGSSP